MDLEILNSACEQATIAKLQKYVDTINSYSYIEEARLDGYEIIIKFKDKIKKSKQNIPNLFIYGGVVQREDDDNDETNEKDFITIEGMSI